MKRHNPPHASALSQEAIAASPTENILKRRRMIISRILMWPLLLLILFTSSRWERFHEIDELLFSIGVVLVAVATLGRVWSSLYICGYKTKHLIQDGPYSLTRNPLYFFSALGIVGVGLATETLIIPAVMALLFSLYYPFVILGEEGKLLALHGEEYAQYMRTVPRFWPRFKRPSEPATYTIIPQKIRRALLDSFWFLGMIGLLEVTEGLRESGIIPVLFRIY